MKFIIGIILGPFKWWILAGAILALGGLYTWRVHSERDYGRAEVQLKWDATEGRRKDAAIAAADANAKETLRRLDRAADAERKRNESQKAADARIAGLLGELRNRSDRPAGGRPASNTTTGPACTGAELYRSDGEFLARESARAQRILAEREYCHDRYDSLTVKP